MIDEGLYLIDAVKLQESGLGGYYLNTLNFKPILSILPYFFSILFEKSYLVLHVLVIIADTSSSLLLYFIARSIFSCTRYKNLNYLFFLISATYIFLTSKTVIGVASAQIEHFQIYILFYLFMQLLIVNPMLFGMSFH